MAVVETKGLCCKIGYRYLLKDIDWQVEKGEHWVAFGMNGCGKTTLLSIIAGFRAQTHGELGVFGEPYTKENILSFRQRIKWTQSQGQNKKRG